MQSDLRVFLAGLAFTSHLLAHSPTSLRARSKTLSPGWQSDEFTVDLGTEWQTPSDSPLKINPGNHTVRFVLKVAEAGNNGSSMRVCSNPVVIVVEIITSTSGPPTKPAGRPRMRLE